MRRRPRVVVNALFTALTEYRQRQRELAAQELTLDRLSVAYRACLTTGGSDAACSAQLAVYRGCLLTRAKDAQCRPRLPE
ncbi:MAG: hypothetical protein OXC69_01670 [Candidatus Tectomicrobia bacterium]|nr:hypothetical protein [Candidatus Tectomicrobia bacterium]